MSDMQKDAPVETAPVAQKKGIKRHCAQFWWMYLVGFIIVAVLAVVLIIFVAVPKIAQKKLDEAVLTIEGIVITNSQSDSLNMAINSTIYADDSIHATIDGFTGDMYLEELEDHIPFASVDFPETTTAKVQTVNVSQTLNIVNLDALTTFNTLLIRDKTVKVTVYGETHIHVKGLSKAYGVTFKKTVDIPALDGFSGLSVTNATISISPNENGDNFVGSVNIPNHSIFTLDIGNGTFSTEFEGEDVGVTRLDNMFLSPGDNKVAMRAAIQQGPILRANFESPYCSGADFPMHLTGQNVTNNGQNLTYYGIALSRNVQVTNIPLGRYLSRDLNITATCSEDTDE